MRQLALLALIFALIGTITVPASAEPGLGAAAPALVAQDLEGNPVSLAELNAAGKFVMLDFWASWCGPCMGEIPFVAPFYDGMKGDSFELIGVSLDSPATEEKMHEVIGNLGMHYPIIYDISSYPVFNGKQVTFQRGGGWKNRLGVQWGIKSIPATFLVNPDGVIVLKNIRGEEGLALVMKIVTDIPDFMPPPVVLSAEATGSLVTARADIAEITVDPHRFTFSIACYVPGENEGEEGAWVGGDYTLDIVPEPENWALTLTPSPENEGDAAVTVEMQEQYIVITLASDKPLTTGYFEMGMFIPQLESDIGLGSFYARPPKPEAEESEGS